MTQYDHALVWFRRDLRLHDHAALHHALRQARKVSCVFVFDLEILDELPTRTDRRVEFLWHAIVDLNERLRAHGGGLWVLHGKARECIPELADALSAGAVYVNHDYEPQAMARDAAIEQSLARSSRAMHSFKDQCIFEKAEILTQARKPFTVFTPYKNAWLKALTAASTREYVTQIGADQLTTPRPSHIPSLTELGFEATNLTALKLPLGVSGGEQLLSEFKARIEHYRERRDFPALRGPSYLSVHLRFGTVSIRSLVRAAIEQPNEGAQTWLSELIWREFYFQILWHHPHVVTRSFKPEYESLAFTNDAQRFRAWCEGQTGYPIVDAAMRQINNSGYMHNRLRMIAASFLAKDLHVDWRWGERYFAQHLNDFDLSANNGGWQWAASTGCDAQPYFRIFNPVTQSEKFDPDGKFIKLYVPELASVPTRYIHAPWTMSASEQRAANVRIGENYPAPVVDHAKARLEALAIYGVASKKRSNQKEGGDDESQNY